MVKNMRKNFYEILSEMQFDVSREYATLLRLFQVEATVPMGGYIQPLAVYVDKVYFRTLPFRGGFVSLNEMMSAIPIKPGTRNLDDLFVLCEFLVALLPEKRLIEDGLIRKQGMTIIENIFYILDKTNHELTQLPGSDERMIITEKNKGTTLAVEIVGDAEIAIDLIEYNHFALKGDLSAKKKILSSIGMYIEPILRSKALQNAGYRKLESDTGFVFNNFHIRHNNKEGAKAQDYVLTLSNEELEDWYDKAYEMAISVIIINDHLPTESKLAELKRNYHWKT